MERPEAKGPVGTLPMMGAQGKMTTVSQMVEDQLKQDLVINEALARGFLSARRAARRMIEEQGWDVTEEAVVSAIRRYEPPPHTDLEDVFHELAGARRSVEMNLAMVHAPRTRKTVSALASLMREIPSERTFGFLPHDDTLTILVDDRHMPEVREALPMDADKLVIDRPLDKIELTFRESSPLNATAIAVCLYHLGHHGIEAVDVLRAGHVCSVFVRQRDFPRALDLLKDIMNRCPS